MTSYKSLTKSLSTSISCHKIGINDYIIPVAMPWSFAQPLSSQCNGVSKTAAGCNDDLNSLSGNCPTYLARKLRPATKSVSMIPFNQNVSTFTKWELKEGPRAQWRRQSKVCHEHMTVHTQPLLCSGVIAITTRSDCTLIQMFCL